MAAQDGDLAQTVAEPSRQPGGFGIQEGERVGSEGGHQGYLIAFFLPTQLRGGFNPRLS